MNDSPIESTNNQKLNTSAPNPISPHMTKGYAVGYHAESHSAVANVPASNTFVRDLHRDDANLNAALQHLNKATPGQFRSGSTSVEIIQSATTFMRASDGTVQALSRTIQALNGTIQALNGTIQTLSGTIQAFSGSTQTHPVIDTKNSQSSNADPFPKRSTASTSLVTSLHSDSTESSSKDIEKFATNKISPRTGDQDTRNNDIMEITRIADQKRPESERMHCPDQQTPAKTTSFEQSINELSTDNTSGRDTEPRALTCSPEDDPKAMYGHEPTQNRQCTSSTKKTYALKKKCIDRIRSVLHLKGSTAEKVTVFANIYIELCQEHHQKMQLNNNPSPTDPLRKAVHRVSTQILNRKSKQIRARRRHEPKSPNNKRRINTEQEHRRKERVHNAEQLLQKTVEQDQRSGARLALSLATQNIKLVVISEAADLIDNCMEQHTLEHGYTNIHRIYQLACLKQLTKTFSSDPHSPTGLSNTSFSETPDRSSIPPNDSLSSFNPKPHNPELSFFFGDLPTINNFPSLSGSYDESKKSVRPTDSLSQNLLLSPQTASRSSYQTFTPRDTASQDIQRAPNLENWIQANSQLLPQTSGSSYQTFTPRDTVSQDIQRAPNLESWMQANSQLLPQTSGSSYQTFTPRDTMSQDIQHAPDTNSSSTSDSELTFTSL